LSGSDLAKCLEYVRVLARSVEPKPKNLATLARRSLGAEAPRYGAGQRKLVIMAFYAERARFESTERPEGS
jgi:hypothetical protein